MQGPFELDLPGGLDPGRHAALGGLLRDVAGQVPVASSEATGGLFWPLMLLAEVPGTLLDPGFATGSGEILVHEALRLRVTGGAAPLGEALVLAGTISVQGGMTALAAALRDRAGRIRAEIEVRLRRVPIALLGAGARLTLARAARGGALRQVAVAPVAQASIDVHVALTGDPNPIHTDPVQARVLGLAATVVPGALLVGLIDPLLPRLVPGAPAPVAASVRFLAPALVGQGVTYAVAEGAAPGAPLRVHVAAADGAVLALADLVFEP